MTNHTIPRNRIYRCDKCGKPVLGAEEAEIVFNDIALPEGTKSIGNFRIVHTWTEEAYDANTLCAGEEVWPYRIWIPDLIEDVEKVSVYSGIHPLENALGPEPVNSLKERDALYTRLLEGDD